MSLNGGKTPKTNDSVGGAANNETITLYVGSQTVAMLSCVFSPRDHMKLGRVVDV